MVAARTAAKPAAVGSIARRTSQRSLRNCASGPAAACHDRISDRAAATQRAASSACRRAAHLHHALVREHLHRLAQDRAADAELRAQVGLFGERDDVAARSDSTTRSARRVVMRECSPPSGIDANADVAMSVYIISYDLLATGMDQHCDLKLKKPPVVQHSAEIAEQRIRGARPLTGRLQ